MIRLIEFIRNNSNVFLFVLIELFAFYLVVSNNAFQRSSVFTTSNVVVGGFLEGVYNVEGYFELKRENKTLLSENERLKKQLAYYKERGTSANYFDRNFDFLNRYNYTSAKVVNNSVVRARNFFTINRGSKDGIQPGMGVVAASGIAGTIYSCSAYYSTVISVLNTENYVAAKLGKDNIPGTLHWQGDDHRYINLDFIPRYYKVQKGDSVLTSSFNSIFPSEVLVGKVVEVVEVGDQPNLNIKVELASDMKALDYVYVIKDELKPQLDSLQQEIK